MRRTWSSEWDCPREGTQDGSECDGTVMMEYDVPARNGGPEDFIPVEDDVYCSKGHQIPQKEVDRMTDDDWARFCSDEADRLEGEYYSAMEHKWEVENDR